MAVHRARWLGAGRVGFTAVETYPNVDIAQVISAHDDEFQARAPAHAARSVAAGRAPARRCSPAKRGACGRTRPVPVVVVR